MSKITFEPNSVGTGTFTLKSPDSNNNRTFLLPDADGDLMTTNTPILESSLPVGSILQVQHVRYDDRISISAPAAPSTTDITELAVSITPRKSNSLIHAQFYIQGEGTDHNIGFRIRVDGSEPSDGYNTDAGNQRYSFLTSANYDGNTASTPRLEIVNYFHQPGSTNPVTYSPSVGDSGGTSTFRMNRTAGSSGSSNNEVGVSWGIVYEIAQ